MNMGYVSHQMLRTFRLCYRNSNENELSKKLKRQISTSSQWSPSSNSIFGYDIRRKLWCDVKASCNEKLVLLGEILTKQCNFYASQRIRRMGQVWQLYAQLYTEKTIRHIISRFARNLREQKKRPIAMLLGIALFSWEKDKITDEEVSDCIYELDRLQIKEADFRLTSVYGCELAEKLNNEGWENVIQKDNLQLWRKSFPDSYLYEYKILGTFLDVSARSFFNVQTDIEYRKTWDKLVIKLDVVDQEEAGDCEVVHWVMHYPYPMYSREYVYIRRAVINPKSNTMVLVSRAVEHPSCPVNKKYVRVSKYSSRMVIRPHRSYDENGFDYVLTYFDDPQAAFPSPAYNWMASSGVPDFVERLHAAALEVHRQQIRNKTPSVHQKPSTQPCPSGDMEYAYM